MAKNKAIFSFKDMVGSIDGIIKKTPILRETAKSAAKRGTIPTGIYVLNAALSGSLWGGVPDNRITIFGGVSGSGKSFLCYNLVREFQKKGGSVIYIDTEFAIELDQLPNYGIDISEDKFMLMRSNIIEDLKIFTTQFLDNLKEQKAEGKEIGKVMIILDSIGQMGSRKEVEDALSGKEKADFTKSKALGSFFRIINSDLGFLQIPMVCTNHTYLTMDMYPQEKMKGGEGAYYSASTVCFLAKSKLRDDNQDELDLNQSGIIVTAKMVKNRMAKPKKVKFEISFVSGSNPFIGLDWWCNEENYEQIGIAKGKMVGDKFVAGGNRWYVRHLGTHVPFVDIFTERVFTKEVLDGMEPVINDYFRYKSLTEIGEIQKKIETAKANSTSPELLDGEIDSSKFFEDDDE